MFLWDSSSQGNGDMTWRRAGQVGGSTHTNAISPAHPPAWPSIKTGLHPLQLLIKLQCENLEFELSSENTCPDPKWLGLQYLIMHSSCSPHYSPVVSINIHPQQDGQKKR